MVNEFVGLFFADVHAPQRMNTKTPVIPRFSVSCFFIEMSARNNKLRMMLEFSCRSQGVNLSAERQHHFQLTVHLHELVVFILWEQG